MFRHVDIIMREDYGIPGYPMINVTYDPDEPTDGQGTQIILGGPQYQPWQIFHELGHSHFPSFYVNEVESIVNLLHVAVANKGFEMELDSAFGWSIDNRYDITLDVAAITLMISEPFRHNNPLGWDRMAYQHRGHGKYMDVARLFGWDALGNMYKKINEDYNRGIVIKKTEHPTDDRILRMSVAAGADLRPLLHFWGRQPEDNVSLSDSIKAANLPASQIIYDALEHYKTVVPENLKECQAHAKLMYPGDGHPSSKGHDLERDHAFAYENWNESYAKEALDQIEMIQNLYFPDCRPTEDQIIMRIKS